MIKEIPSIKEESRFDHGAMDLFIIQLGELVPFRQEGDGMSAFCGRIRIGFETTRAARSPRS